jgi:hypothetical protein
MSALRGSLIALALIGTLSAGAALAQTPGTGDKQTPGTGDKMRAAASSTADDVSKWTNKQWNAAKAKWSKEKDKWGSCNKQATEQKLTGRQSWSFIYTCMAS